jgi:protein tyrosine phosphatase (PTP) superfamily phosphohydrolase (DUF442 family)
MSNINPSLQGALIEAENTHQVFDWLWSSGQLTIKDIESLPALGIEVVINLALPTSSNALPGESEFVTRQGITYIQIPVEWERPELHQLMQFFGILNAVKERHVWVHCQKNMRVSAFIYLYRKLCLAESEDAATHPMREIWVPNETWRVFIRSVLSSYSHIAVVPT